MGQGTTNRTNVFPMVYLILKRGLAEPKRCKRCFAENATTLLCAYLNMEVRDEAVRNPVVFCFQCACSTPIYSLVVCTGSTLPFLNDTGERFSHSLKLHRVPNPTKNLT